MSKIYNIVVGGLGGQGNLFLAKTLCRAAIAKGCTPVMSEIHGQAQRGGTVVTNVRIGDVRSPMIADGEADWVVSAELHEALRLYRKASPTCTAIVSTSAVYPLTAFCGYDTYPSRAEVEKEIRRLYRRALFVDPDAVARECGHPQAANVAMLGALMAVGGLPVDEEDVQKTLKASVSMWTWMVDKKAFRMGYDLARKRLEEAA
jgi:indolepyruvate ferredoxin oxidoreductase, beta subunit